MKGLKLLFFLLSLDLALFVKHDGFVPVIDALDAALVQILAAVGCDELTIFGLKDWQVRDASDSESLLKLIQAVLVCEGNCQPWHLRKVLLELALFFVQGNIDDLALLAFNVDFCVELLQYLQESLAWWAPRCAEEYSDIIVRVLELIN